MSSWTTTLLHSPTEAGAHSHSQRAGGFPEASRVWRNRLHRWCAGLMARPTPGAMPVTVRTEVAGLSSAIKSIVPARTPTNLLIGSWNLRALAGLTDSWDAPETASPRRDRRAAALIAAVISAFDVVAVQEVRRETKALRAI